MSTSRALNREREYSQWPSARSRGSMRHPGRTVGLWQVLPPGARPAGSLRVAGSFLGTTANSLAGPISGRIPTAGHPCLRVGRSAAVRMLRTPQSPTPDCNWAGVSAHLKRHADWLSRMQPSSLRYWNRDAYVAAMSCLAVSSSNFSDKQSGIRRS